MSGKHIIIAGGGTGGHIFPAVAVANAMRQLDDAVEILFVGAKGKMEMEKVPQEGFDIVGLDIAGFNRSNLLKNISLPAKLLKSFLQVRTIFKHFKPDAAFGVGGYSSFPVLRFAQAKGIPTFLHESNAFAGKSNILLGKKATKIFVAAPDMDRFFPADRMVVSGNPVRQSIAELAIAREEALAYFGLDANRGTILVSGGSLGARSINEAVLHGLHKFGANNLQVIWQTGKLFDKQAQEAVAGQRNIWTNAFIQRMDFAYAAADIIISRAGAMSVTEVITVSKPAVFVPYPHAAEDHQTANALNLVHQGAALMVEDAEAASQLIDTCLALMQNTEMKESMAEKLSQMKTSNADIIIAETILKSINA